MANALEILPLLIEKNSADIEKIVAKLGFGNILSVLPNLLNIVSTIQEAQKSGPVLRP